jgi:hypothetical protein
MQSWRKKSLWFVFAAVAGTVAVASANLISTYQAADTIKVIFAKQFFYNNTEPLNSIGCAGDAKYYFDPQLDRITPSKPSWLRNVSVDITNANAPFGASNSFLCSYGAAQSSAPPECLGPFPPSYCNVPPAPSNCAAFDDMQQLTGYRTRAYIIGGYACNTAGCASNTYSDQIFEVLIDDTTQVANAADAVTITRAPSGMTIPITVDSTGTTALSRLLHSSWVFDEIHEWIFGIGGVDTNGVSANIRDSIVRLFQKPAPGSTADPTIPGIEALDINTATKILTANAGAAGLRSHTLANMSNPEATLGASSVYIRRRDPGLSRRLSMETAGGSNGGETCSVGYLCVLSGSDTSVNAEHGWHDGDYFLNIGGINSGAAPARLSSAIAALIPHRIQTQNGSIATPAKDGLSWEWLNHWQTRTNSHFFRVIDLRTDGTLPNSTNPYSSWDHTDRFGRATAGLFPARAFHRSVYDPRTHRVYTFGGIITDASAALSATSSTSMNSYGSVFSSNDITPTSETWILDLPHSGRKPTLGCRTTNSAVTATSLPGLIRSRYNNTNNELVDLTTFSAADLEYETNAAIFPPGGCMQYAQPYTASINTGSTNDDGGTATTYTPPPMRLEHQMAFDERQGVVIMFGGCNNAPPYNAATGLQGNLGTNPIAYDPLRNCTSRSNYLNDTWMYIPPQTLESALVTPLSGSSTAYVFGRPDLLAPLDPLTLGLPLIYPNGSTTMTSAELHAYTNGAWIQLYSDTGATTQSDTTTPLARASASFWYDKAHGKFYMFGGQTCNGCTTNNGTTNLLNDIWEFTPPNIANCTASTASCSSSGTWRLIRDNTATHSFSSPASTADYPPPTRSAAGVYATRAPGAYYHYGDQYYTVSDNACEGQGPILGSAATSKERVGAIYVDIDRSQFATNENLLINLKLLPFAPASYDAAGADKGLGTKLPGYDFNGTYGASTADDHDQAGESDRAYIRVSLLRNPFTTVDALLSQLQPRFRAYQAPGTAVIAQEFDIASSGTGQPLEKQIFVPLSMDSTINLIKIERVRGTVKFFDMTITKF